MIVKIVQVCYYNKLLIIRSVGITKKIKSKYAQHIVFIALNIPSLCRRHSKRHQLKIK